MSILVKNIVHNGQIESITIYKSILSFSIAGYYCNWNEYISLKIRACVCMCMLMWMYMYI